MRLAPIFCLGLCLFAAVAHARVVAKEVPYRDGDTAFAGYVAYDDAKTSAPGVLIVPQWMGLTDYEKGRARQLAELGYVAFGADIYGQGHVAQDMQEAGTLAGKFKGIERTPRKSQQMIRTLFPDGFYGFNIFKDGFFNSPGRGFFRFQSPCPDSQNRTGRIKT